MSISSLTSQLKRLVGTARHDVLAAGTSVEEYDASVEAWSEVYGLAGNDDLTATAFAAAKAEDAPNWDDYRDVTVRASTLADGGEGNNTIVARSEGVAETNVRSVHATNDVLSGPGRAVVDAAARASGWNADYAAANTIGTGLSNDRITAAALATNVDDWGSGDMDARNVISSGSGHDVISAEALIHYGERRFALNEIDSGTGDDTIVAVAQVGDDWTTSTATGEARNTINARAGNDHATALASGLSATNWISAGTGDDTVFATAHVQGMRATGGASNTVLAGAGDDFVEAKVNSKATEAWQVWGENTLRGEAGHDILIAEIDGEGINLLDGGTGDDVLTARLHVENGRRMYGAEGENRLIGGQGDDTLTSIVSAGADGARITVFLDGGDGNDTLTANYDAGYAGYGVAPESFTQTLHGGAGDDVLTAIIDGVWGENNTNRLYGGEGDDALTLWGGRNNILDGGTGDDFLWLWDGQDSVLDGGAGDDVLYTGIGDNILIGGAGDDVFLFDLSLYADEPWSANQGFATLADFDSAADRLGFLSAEDRGAPGLADDLDAISAIEDFGPGGDVVASFAPGTGLVFSGLGTGGVTSFADLVADPGAQLIVWDALV